MTAPSLIHDIQQLLAQLAAELAATGGPPPPVAADLLRPPHGMSLNVLDFVLGDGTDEAAGLQAAITAAGPVGQLDFPVPPVGYGTSRPLVVATPGLTLRGALCPRDTTETGSRILGLGAGSSLLSIQAGGVKLLNLLLDGQEATLRGIEARGAYRARIEDCLVKRCTGAGLFLGTVGNNNLLCVRNSTFMQNDVGILVAEARDNNGLECYSVECSSNASHGLQYSGQGPRVVGGIMNGNGGYGIQLSDPQDAGYTMGGVVFFPWLEDNHLGGIRGAGKSVRNVAYLDWHMQSLTMAEGSLDLLVRASNSPGALYTVTGGLVARQFIADTEPHHP